MEERHKSSQNLEKQGTNILTVLYEDLMYYTLDFLNIFDLFRLNGVTKLDVFVKTLTRSIRNYKFVKGGVGQWWGLGYEQ